MRPVRDGAGVVDFVCDWVNRRASGASGPRPPQLIGRRLLEVLPAFPRALFDDLVAVLSDASRCARPSTRRRCMSATTTSPVTSA